MYKVGSCGFPHHILSTPRSFLATFTQPLSLSLPLGNKAAINIVRPLHTISTPIFLPLFLHQPPTKKGIMSFSHTHICGCYYTDHGPNSHRSRQRNYLPQVQLESHTTITPLYFTTKLSQTFTNPTGNQLPQTRYTFPLYDGVAVSAFTCTIGDKVVKGYVDFLSHVFYCYT